jgi:hypothetical protein
MYTELRRLAQLMFRISLVANTFTGAIWQTTEGV